MKEGCRVKDIDGDTGVVVKVTQCLEWVRIDNGRKKYWQLTKNCKKLKRKNDE